MGRPDLEELDVFDLEELFDEGCFNQEGCDCGGADGSADSTTGSILGGFGIPNPLSWFLRR